MATYDNASLVFNNGEYLNAMSNPSGMANPYGVLATAREYQIRFSPTSTGTPSILFNEFLGSGYGASVYIDNSGRLSYAVCGQDNNPSGFFVRKLSLGNLTADASGFYDVTLNYLAVANVTGIVQYDDNNGETSSTAFGTLEIFPQGTIGPILYVSDSNFNTVQHFLGGSSGNTGDAELNVLQSISGYGATFANALGIDVPSASAGFGLFDGYISHFGFGITDGILNNTIGYFYKFDENTGIPVPTVSGKSSPDLGTLFIGNGSGITWFPGVDTGFISTVANKIIDANSYNVNSSTAHIKFNGINLARAISGDDQNLSVNAREVVHISGFNIASGTYINTTVNNTTYGVDKAVGTAVHFYRSYGQSTSGLV